jgi:hypothetical protein
MRKLSIEFEITKLETSERMARAGAIRDSAQKNSARGAVSCATGNGER